MPTRVFDILTESAERFADNVAFSFVRKGKRVSYTYKEYQENVNQISKGLIALGVRKGDKVATISPNRPEWNFLDMAVMQVGAVHVPIYPTYSLDDFVFLLENSDTRFAFVAGRVLYNKLKSGQNRLPLLEDVYTIDEVDGIPNSLSKLKSDGDSVSLQQLEEARDVVSPQDTATIMYSSGTYWKPLGCETSHRSLCEMTTYIANDYELTENDVGLSFLPLSHMYERGHSYPYQHSGMSIHFADATISIAQNISDIQPTIFTSVPAILEGVYEAISTVEANGRLDIERTKQVRKFAEGFDISSTIEGSGLKQHKDIFEDWKNRLGGRVRIISSAAAPLRASLVNCFWAMGVKLLECYGMTELTLITMNSVKNGVKAGTVGSPLSVLDLKLLSDGEILVKSPFSMMRYYKEPEKTRNAIDKNGWFHTGDVGEWVEEKYLRIVGRKKVIFKVATGKYVLPEKIEALLRKSEVIDQALVFENGGSVEALIVPSELERNKREIDQVKIEKEVNKVYNSKVEPAERVKHIHVQKEPWTLENGELTPSLKPKRLVIMKKAFGQTE